MNRFRIAACWVALTVASLVMADEVSWQTGALFDRALELPITSQWSNMPCGEALRTVANSRKVAILIDRRIDAESPLTLQVRNESLRTALARIAASKDVAVSFFRPVVYFGPVETAGKLRTVAELARIQALRQPPAVRAKFLKTKPLAWGEASEPRQLLAQLADEAGVELRGTDQVPHDLWREANLPPLPWTDRMLLVLIQFDFTLAISPDGRTIEIVPLSKQPAIERRYAAGAAPAARMAQLRKMFPLAKIDGAGQRINVRANMETHEQIADLVAGKKTKSTTVQNLPETYTLNVERLPLEKVMSQLSVMLKLEVEYDRAAIRRKEIALDQLVTFRVREASLDELLTAVLRDAGLRFERRDKQVRIGPN